MQEIIEERSFVLPVRIVKTAGGVRDARYLLSEKPLIVTFREERLATLVKKDGERTFALLDFGKELHGGVRLVTACANCRVRLTFGESVAEALSEVGENGASNDHALRDFEIFLPFMADQRFGQTGFRFLKIELLDENARLELKCAVAVSETQKTETEGHLRTNDERLNEILDACVYTCRLNLQNGVIWDGIKRDRLVWSGDLNAEIRTALYTFGNIPNIKNSLSVLRESTPLPNWINDIPSYSAWWIVNLCDYCRLSGDEAYLAQNADYALGILQTYDESIGENGDMDFSSAVNKPIGMPFFLDWQSHGTQDGKIGTAMLILWAAKKFAESSRDTVAARYYRRLDKKLRAYKDAACAFKQTRAMQILATGETADGKEFLEKDGAHGFSTFMAYYIVSALSEAGSGNTCALIKEYYGAMLDCGATTFWEDFDLNWIKEAHTRIDEEPTAGKKDMHRDHGAYCYKGLRHSLCHGWSCGVVAFAVERLLGLEVLENGFKRVRIRPNLTEIREIKAKIPTVYGFLEIECDETGIRVNAPKEIVVEY